MNYAVAWELEAQNVVRSVEIEFAEGILDGVDRLCHSPTALSRPSTRLGYPEQVYEFELANRRVVLSFQYSQDETVLFISRVSIFAV